MVAGAQASADLLAHEARLIEGSAPPTLRGAVRQTPTYEISRDAFLLRVPNGLVFHYERGRGVKVTRPREVDANEIGLFLNGSVYGAIAWINGYVPLHAAAVVHKGAVFAMAGRSGIGKSTLAAALGQRGMPLLADDVLVLDLSDPSQIVCLPGHKQIKLWNDALQLTGACAERRVRAELDKYYAVPPGGTHSKPLPLAHLTFLDDKIHERVSLRAISGVARFAQLHSALYRPRFYAAIADTQAAFYAIARISHAVPMTIFDRPFDKDMFDAGVELMNDFISRQKLDA